MVTPTRLMRAKRFVLALSLLTTACGGGSGTISDAGPSTSAATTQTTQQMRPLPQSTDPARKAQAEAAVVKLSDFPPGWREQDPELALNVEAVWDDLTRCLGVDISVPPLGIATSRTILRGIATQAASTVEYLPEARVQAISSALSGPGFEECLTKAFEADAVRSGPEGGVPGPSKVTPLDFAKVGQITSASRINVTFKLDTLEVPIFQDFLVVFDGQALTRMFFLNPGGPFPPELERTLVEKVVGRA